MREELTSRRSTPACPGCGSADVARILRGYPAFSRELEADLVAGKVVLGGCLAWNEQSNHQCNACGLEFRDDGRPVQPDPYGPLSRGSR